jgi:thymidylate synthase
LSKGFPLLTTKKVFTRGIIVELLWFLRGDSNIKFLVDNNVHIWDDWAYKRFKKAQNFKFHPDSIGTNFKLTKKEKEIASQDEFIQHLKELPEDSYFVKDWGDLITVYGKMWRKWPASDGREIDQLGWVIEGLKTKPYRKSYVVSAWNPDFIYAMASKGNANEVPPFCHTMYQFSVANNKLNCALYQRSADMFLGVPFNIASYSLLLLMVSKVTGIKPGEYVHFFGDAHIYSNHFDQVNEQLKRKPKKMPNMKLNPKKKNIDDFTLEDFTLENYNPHPPIKGEIANIGGF